MIKVREDLTSMVFGDLTVLCKTKEGAIKLRLEAEKKYFSEFAPQKYLFEQYGIQEDFNE